MPFTQTTDPKPQGVYTFSLQLRDAEPVGMYVTGYVKIEEPDGRVHDPANEALLDSMMERLFNELQGLTDFTVQTAYKEFSPPVETITPTPAPEAA